MNRQVRDPAHGRERRHREHRLPALELGLGLTALGLGAIECVA